LLPVHAFAQGALQFGAEREVEGEQ
jgi:hypothetical protein